MLARRPQANFFVFTVGRIKMFEKWTRASVFVEKIRPFVSFIFGKMLARRPIATCFSKLLLGQGRAF